ncbi:MAG: hypothetical protein CMJ48_13485 [Planctomycetaceae bacterium]|nr:hypothetical protein [Planctomycetaceae bacterium]
MESPEHRRHARHQPYDALQEDEEVRHLLRAAVCRLRLVVPEPSTFALVGIGSVCMLGVGVRRRRRNMAA